MPVPRREALRVLCSHPSGRPVGASEDDGHRDGPRGHVARLGCRVDDLIDGLHGEVERHELAHRPQPCLLKCQIRGW